MAGTESPGLVEGDEVRFVRLAVPWATDRRRRADAKIPAGAIGTCVSEPRELRQGTVIDVEVADVEWASGFVQIGRSRLLVSASDLERPLPEVSARDD